MKEKVLFLDIETAPIIAYVWSLYTKHGNSIGKDQVISDWHLLSWAAKWEGEKEVLYADQSQEPKIENDKKLVRGMWNLLDEADIIVTQNGKSFDARRLNARFIVHNLGPPSPYRHEDTLLIAKKYFGFSSNKLEYMSAHLNLKYQKSGHKKFPGFELWKECLAKNPAAWNEMKKYNILDVLALEELYLKLAPWGGRANRSTFRGKGCCPNCGGNQLVARGTVRTKTGENQRYCCAGCGSWGQTRIRKNGGADEVVSHVIRG